MSSRSVVRALAVVAAWLVVPASAFAAPGDLDLSFGGDGIVTNRIDIADAALQADGRVVVVGTIVDPELFDRHAAIFRYGIDGRLDRSFSGDGRVIYSEEDGVMPAAVQVQADGKIVVAGDRGFDVAIARFLADGSADASFSGDGQVRQDGAYGGALDLAIDPRGRIVVTTTGLGPRDTTLDVMRFGPSGGFDAGYGGDGFATTGCVPATVGGGLVLSGARAVVAGATVSSPEPSSDMCAARLTGAGLPDRSFGGSGVVLAGFGPAAWANDVAIDPTGAVTIAGSRLESATSTKSFVALARFLPDGSPDASFGDDGRVVTTDREFGGRSSTGVAEAIVHDGSGRLLLAGYKRASQWVVARYRADGSLDPSFGDGGDVTTLTGNAQARAIAAWGGRIVVAGLYNPLEDYTTPPVGAVVAYEA